MGKFIDARICDVVNNINESYFLPDIQREYVWLQKSNERKIEKLFDSILRGYPIGSFLFWKLKKTDIGSGDLNFQIYKFIEEYGAGANHNIVKDIRNINSNDLYLVLDGQQRLTSLYIGLRGSRMVKKARRDEYEKQLLYLNLGYKPNDEDAEDSYQFEFMNPNNVPANDENNYWFAVGDILKLEGVIKFSRKENLSEVAAENLEKLRNAICVESLISYFEECDKNMDKVLKIFIRVNSGGVTLSYSDLLMSIMTSYFTDDIRSKVNEKVDEFKAWGFDCFGRDQILKTALMLIDAKHTFCLKNFNKTNLNKIKDYWDKIITAMEDAVYIVRDFGYAGHLSYGYVISVIAYYLYKKNKAYKSVTKNDKNAMFKFVRDAQIVSYFRASLDQQLNNILEGMENGNVRDFTQFNVNMANLGANKALKVSSANIEDFLTLTYGQPAILPLLQVLYPNMDYENKKFHIDHIYPRSKFKPNKAGKDYIKEKDCLFNLQLLEGSLNKSKNDSDPDEWIKDEFGGNPDKIAYYKESNFIDQSCTLTWADFDNFRNKRKEALREKLEEIFK